MGKPAKTTTGSKRLDELYNNKRSDQRDFVPPPTVVQQTGDFPQGMQDILDQANQGMPKPTRMLRGLK